MKMHTTIYARLESRGYPDKTLDLNNVTVKDTILAIMKWLPEVSMGSRIIMTLGRTREDVVSKSERVDMDLESAFAQIMLEDGVE